MSDMIIYTDGACSGNPGPGGWGVLIETANGSTELYGGAAQTTNNRMEMIAAIEALRSLPNKTSLTLITDSTYVRDGITQWLASWKQRGWKTAGKKPVKNIDLWQALDTETQRHIINWQWVRGHTGHPGNERADELARQGMAEYQMQRG